jgi:transcriptional regulator GlxA family with amidase domain
MLKPTAPINRWLSSNLAMLPSMVGRLTGIVESLAKVQILDLIAGSLMGLDGGPSSRRASRFEALLRLKTAVDSLLTDPRLTAADVAEKAGMSVRYANNLLAREKTSVMRLVLSMRLARCRDALDDVLQSHRTVGEIARSWGFSDMTHFGRRFRKTYDLLPSEYRNHKID